MYYGKALWRDAPFPCKEGSMMYAKLAKNVPTGAATGRKAKTDNSTPKSKRKRSAPRFYEIKIRITAYENR
jgi:hypothetical protein